VLELLVGAFELLAEAPGAGRIREDLGSVTLRCWAITPFVVFYEAEQLPIVILRVLHGMRDLGPLLGNSCVTP